MERTQYNTDPPQCPITSKRIFSRHPPPSSPLYSLFLSLSLNIYISLFCLFVYFELTENSSSKRGSVLLHHQKSLDGETARLICYFFALCCFCYFYVFLIRRISVASVVKFRWRYLIQSVYKYKYMGASVCYLRILQEIY